MYGNRCGNVAVCEGLCTLACWIQFTSTFHFPLIKTTHVLRSAEKKKVERFELEALLCSALWSSQMIIGLADIIQVDWEMTQIGRPLCLQSCAHRPLSKFDLSHKIGFFFDPYNPATPYILSSVSLPRFFTHFFSLFSFSFLFTYSFNLRLPYRLG